MQASTKSELTILIPEKIKEITSYGGKVTYIKDPPADPTVNGAGKNCIDINTNHLNSHYVETFKDSGAATLQSAMGLQPQP